jgi:subtilase family serine protease
VFTETIDQLETFTVNAKAFATNMWGAQIFGVDKNIFYIVLAIIVALVAVTFALLIVFRKRR